MSPRPVPRATYRLQLTRDFTFADAAELAPYLRKLGISHAYLSPILKARPGSTHGYDTVDHTQLNPELGTRDDFRRLAAALRAEGIGIILDIVPNHMGIGTDQNPLWLDVLENGQKSRYAEWFDIDWQPNEPDLSGKLLVPFLGSSLGEALDAGKLELRQDGESFAVWAEGTHKLPVRLDDYAGLDVAHLNAPAGRADLLALLERQHWRAAKFTVAADDINYRRFFIVSDLAGIRVERDDVFAHVHKLTFELVAEGLVDGLRVDHIDGLYDPADYLRRLRAACPKPIYLVVEKILGPHEQLRADWHVEGTTGYEFGAAVNRLLVDPAGEAALTKSFEGFTGSAGEFADIEYAGKLAIIDHEMTAELDALATRLRRIAAADSATVDLTRNALRNGLRAAVAEMAVYRTYVTARGASDWDRRMIGLAVARARRRVPEIDGAVLDFLASAMAGAHGGDIAQRIQQYTGPVMAKGLEDTALYRFARLIALNEVGERPDRLGMSIAAMHDVLRARRLHQPNGLLASTTHDTKRGEDTRARISALSGHAEAWAAAAMRWRDLLAVQGAPQIAAEDAYYFFQTLIGAWPGDDTESLRTRVTAAMQKSLREARLRTSWTAPDTDHEAAMEQFIATALAPGDNAFLADFRTFEDRIAWDGACNGLVATVLKLTAPGVPDIYQGAELWEQSLVDPDNRRPVDFAARADLLEASRGQDLRALATHFRDGALKLEVVRRLLALRTERPELFAEGDYQPLLMGDRILAFTRRHGDATLLVLLTLYPARGATGDVPLPPGNWHPVLGDARPFTDGLPIAVFVS